MISSICGPYLACRSKKSCFFSVSDCLTTHTAHHDAYFTVFLWTTTTRTDGQTNYFTPCACVQGKNLFVYMNVQYCSSRKTNKYLYLCMHTHTNYSHTPPTITTATAPLSLKNLFQRTLSQETWFRGSDHSETTPTPCPSTPHPTIVAPSVHTNMKRTATINHLHRPGRL